MFGEGSRRALGASPQYLLPPFFRLLVPTASVARARAHALGGAHGGVRLLARRRLVGRAARERTRVRRMCRGTRETPIWRRRAARSVWRTCSIRRWTARRTRCGQGRGSRPASEALPGRRARVDAATAAARAGWHAGWRPVRDRPTRPCAVRLEGAQPEQTSGPKRASRPCHLSQRSGGARVELALARLWAHADNPNSSHWGLPCSYVAAQPPAHRTVSSRHDPARQVGEL